MPPATVTTWPVTWPESSSEASTTTWRATSSGCATLRSAIVRRDPADLLGIDVAARHRRLRPARRDRVHARKRSHADDLVLQTEQQAAEDRRLRGRVVRVARLADDARRRADEHERAVPVPLDLAQEAAGGEERRGQVLAQRQLPALERQLPDGHVLATARRRRLPRRRRSAERRARLLEEPVDLLLVGQVGLEDGDAAESRPRPRAPAPRRGGSGRRRAHPRPRTHGRTPSRCRPRRR